MHNPSTNLTLVRGLRAEYYNHYTTQLAAIQWQNVVFKPNVWEKGNGSCVSVCITSFYYEMDEEWTLLVHFCKKDMWDRPTNQTVNLLSSSTVPIADYFSTLPHCLITSSHVWYHTLHKKSTYTQLLNYSFSTAPQLLFFYASSSIIIRCKIIDWLQ